MARETALWMQEGVYPARLDRFFIEEVMRRQNRVFRGLTVTPRVAGANFSVDISAGACVVMGTSQDFQGAYFMRMTAPENRPVGPTPAAARTDSVIVHVLDSDADGGAENDWDIEIVEGTILPSNSLLLARIARTPAESAIQAGAITDMAPRGEWSWTVSLAAPTGRGIPGDLWVQC